MPIKPTDPEGVAAERFGKGAPENGAPAESEAPLKRRPGRPKGSGKKKVPAVPPAPLSPEEMAQGAALCSFLAATIWDLLAPLMKRREVTDEEAQKLGGAIFPVLNKYLPNLTDWTLEINLVLVVAVVFQNTQLPKTPKPEVIEGRFDILPPEKN